MWGVVAANMDQVLSSRNILHLKHLLGDTVGTLSLGGLSRQGLDELSRGWEWLEQVLAKKLVHVVHVV